MPLSLSIGFLAEATARLQEIFPKDFAGAAVPKSLRKMQVLIHDGKKVKYVAKRLKALQKVKGHVLGGKLVVTQSLSTGMALVMEACADGEAADQPLVPGVLEQARQLTSGPRLHVVDRGFCDLELPGLFTDENDHFVMRWHRKVKFHRDESRKAQPGKDRYGRPYEQDWGWIGGERDSRRRYVRRIWLKRSAASEDVILLTDLEAAQRYPADDLLQVYLERWGIERMFQQVTEVFQLQALIGSTPEATVFQASFCFLLYNMIQVIRAYVAQGAELGLREVSNELLFYDVRRQLVAWNEVLEATATVRLLSTSWTAAQVSRSLRELLRGAWTERWRKSPSNTHRSPPSKSKQYLEGGHTSVYRLLQKLRRTPG